MKQSMTAEQVRSAVANRFVLAGKDARELHAAAMLEGAGVGAGTIVKHGKLVGCRSVERGSLFRWSAGAGVAMAVAGLAGHLVGAPTLGLGAVGAAIVMTSDIGRAFSQFKTVEKSGLGKEDGQTKLGARIFRRFHKSYSVVYLPDGAKDVETLTFYLPTEARESLGARQLEDLERQASEGDGRGYELQLEIRAATGANRTGLSVADELRVSARGIDRISILDLPEPVPAPEGPGLDGMSR